MLYATDYVQSTSEAPLFTVDIFLWTRQLQYFSHTILTTLHYKKTLAENSYICSQVRIFTIHKQAQLQGIVFVTKNKNLIGNTCFRKTQNKLKHLYPANQCQPKQFFFNLKLSCALSLCSEICQSQLSHRLRTLAGKIRRQMLLE